jgi:hypothetical protein
MGTAFCSTLMPLRGTGEEEEERGNLLDFFFFLAFRFDVNKFELKKILMITLVD